MRIKRECEGECEGYPPDEQDGMPLRGMGSMLEHGAGSHPRDPIPPERSAILEKDRMA